MTAHSLVLAENGGGLGSFAPTLIFIGLMFAVIYFLIIRPQKKKEQERRILLDSVRRGDTVVTIGGIHGKIQSVKEKHIVLLVDREKGLSLKINRSAIHRVVARDEDEDEDR